MAQKLAVLNQLRPRIVSQGVADTETIAKRMSKNTTYNPDELFGMLRLFTKEVITALQSGETVRLDGLVNLSANMKVGGEVDMVVRGDRGAISDLNNPQLWTADKISNREYMNKTAEEIITIWNSELHPEDPVPEEEAPNPA